MHANDHVDPPASHVWVWTLIGTLTLLILACFRHRAVSFRRAREADAAVDEQAPLAPGQRFVSGRVEFAEGCESAVQVHVEQHGTETKSKNGWNHQWKESGRKIFANPFYVCRPSGERVRVEPGADVLLVDKPDQMIWTQKTTRTRIAALTPNEKVIVEGVLGRGHDPEMRGAADYRTSSHGWVMRPLPGERMHLSAEPLGERHRKRARAFMGSAIWLVVLTGFINLLFITYHASFFFGEDTHAQITHKDSYVTTDSKGRRTNHYRVFLSVDTPGEPRLDRELDYDDWKKVEQGMVLSFRHVPSWHSASDPGEGASIHGLPLGFAVLAALLGLGIYFGTVGHRRWYEGRLDNSGSGRLPAPPGIGG